VPAAAEAHAKPPPARHESRSARNSKPAAAPPAAEPEAPPARPTATAPVRIAPEPPRPVPPPSLGANGANYAAVDQCRDRLFLAKEICLAEHCDKAGTRNHPLCVQRRAEIRLREDSKVRQGPQ
jgi:serine/threonine-protein kinase